MFTWKRFGRMSDMAQLQKEIEDILGKVAKDFEKTVDKSNEEVKQIVKNVQSILDNAKGDVQRKIETFTKKDIDIGQLRMDVDKLLTQVSDYLKKEVSKYYKPEDKVKLLNLFETASKLIGEKLEEFHVGDEAVRIRIEVERLLREMWEEIEKRYEKVKGSPQVKEILKSGRKISESVNVEVGKRLEQTKYDRINLRREIKDMLKTISIDLEKSSKEVVEKENVKEMTETVRTLSNEISANVSGMLATFEQKLSEVKLNREITQAKQNIDKMLADLSTEYQARVEHLKGNNYFKEITSNFKDVVEKTKEELEKKFENLNEFPNEYKKEIDDIIMKISTKFNASLNEISNNDNVNEFITAGKEMSDKAYANVSSFLGAVRQQLEEFKKGEAAIQIRKDVEEQISKIAAEFEKFESDIGGEHVKGAIEKFKDLHERAKGDLDDLLDYWSHDREKLKTEITNIINKMITDFESGVKDIKENTFVKETVEKINGITGLVSENLQKILDSIKENETVKDIIKEIRQLPGDVIEEKFEESQLGSESFPANYYRFVSDCKKDGSPYHTCYESNSAQNTQIVFLGKIFNSIVYAVIFVLTVFQIFILNLFYFLPSKKMDNRVVVITGAGNGLGKALTKRFIQLGAKVAAVDINTADNESSADKLRKREGVNDSLKTYTCDVSKPEEVRDLAAKVFRDFGKVDILVNNAGILCCHKITDGSDFAIERVIQVNLNSNFWMVRAFLPMMIERREGHIVFINSESGIHGLTKASSYAASKFGLLGLAYSLAAELRRDPSLNIKVTSVHPIYFASNPDIEKRVKLKSKILNMDRVADLTMHGIRRELSTFCIPLVYGGFVLSTFLRLLPDKLYYNVIDALVGGIRDSAKPAFKDVTITKKIA